MRLNQSLLLQLLLLNQTSYPLFTWIHPNTTELFQATFNADGVWIDHDLNDDEPLVLLWPSNNATTIICIQLDTSAAAAANTTWSLVPFDQLQQLKQEQQTRKEEVCSMWHVKTFAGGVSDLVSVNGQEQVYGAQVLSSYADDPSQCSAKPSLEVVPRIQGRFDFRTNGKAYATFSFQDYLDCFFTARTSVLRVSDFFQQKWRTTEVTQ